MTPFPYSIEVEASVNAARDLMWEHDIRHLPVTQDGELVGVVSERDIGLVLASRAGEDATHISVRETFSASPYTADLNTPLADVLSHMAESQLGSALVTRNGKLVGIFTATDACAAFARHLHELFPDPPDEVA
jgi:acetoin utilization protein AcuB